MSRHLKPFFCAVLAAAAAAGVAAPPPSEHAWRRLGLFEAVFGFAATVVLVFLSKALWTALKRPEDD